MSELLPCPFCGKRPYLIEPDKGDFKWSVSCLHCVAIDMYDISKEGVVEKWNTRHYPPEVQQAVEMMKPKKITYDDSSLGKPGVPEFWIAYCPECNQPIDFNDTPFEFCRRCGQRLAWSV